MYYFWRLGSGRFIKRILQETYAFWRLGSGGWRLTSGGFVKRILDIEGGRVGEWERSRIGEEQSGRPLSFQNPYISLRILSIKLLLEEVGEWVRRMVGD